MKDFVEIMSNQITKIYTVLKKTPEIMTFVGFILEKKNLGIHFMDICVNYLVENKLHVLEEAEDAV